MKYHLIVCVVITLISCKASEKVQRSRALQFYAEHPGELAAKCAKDYPVKDSAGAYEEDSTLMAHNADLTKTLDSINAITGHLRQQILSDTTAVARRYADQIKSIAVRISALNQQYKPCNPEIRYRTRTIYRENVARIAAFQADLDSLIRLSVTSQDKEKQAVKRAEIAESRSRKRLYWILAFLAAIGIVLAARLKLIKI